MRRLAFAALLCWLLSGATFQRSLGRACAHYSDNVLDLLMVCHDLSTEQVKQIWQPFLDWVARSPGAYTIERQPILASMPARHWWDVEWRKQNHQAVFNLDQRRERVPTMPGGRETVASCVVPLWIRIIMDARVAAEDDSRERLAQSLFVGSRYKNIELHFNKGLAGGPREALEATRDTATNPAVLNAFALAIVGDAGGGYPGVRGHEPDVEAGQKSRQEIHKCVNQLRALVPDGGAYVSESDFFQENWQQAYWGSNYARLASVKKKYDPTGLFFVHNGVGSEEWSEDGFVKKGAAHDRGRGA